MDPAKLQSVERNGTAPQRIYGVFDADRVPKLHVRTFHGVKNIALAVSPDCSFRLVHAALAAATKTIDLYIYNVSADHLLALLRSARDDRGVKIRIMYDVMDTRGNERQKLAELGVELKEAPSSNGRKVFTVCHQKFAVIDGRALLLGSANWASTSIPEAPLKGTPKFRKGNREWLVRIDDPDVAAWFATLFRADWDIEELEAPSGAAGALAEAPAVEALEPLKAAAAVKVPDEVFDVAAGPLADGADVTPILSPDNYFARVLELVEKAKETIDVEQQYVIEGGPRTQALLEALARRRTEGVALRIIASAAYAESWDKTVKTLDGAGLLGCLRAIDLRSFTHLHNKGVLVDREHTVVTSTNMSENSITQAREAGVLIRSRVVGQYYGRVVDLDWSSGIDPSDVAAHVAAVPLGPSAAAPETIEVHPADARIL